MQNRVTVQVAGHSYVLLAQEGEEYVRQVADFVNHQLAQTLEGGGEMNQVDCALLTALNIADLYLKHKDGGENLRQQIKDLLEENAQLKMQLHQTTHPRQDKVKK